MVFLLKTHHHQIVTHRALRTSLIPLRKYLRDNLHAQKEVLGYNLAALRYLKRQEEATRTASFLDDNLTDEDKIKDLRSKVATSDMKKRKRIAVHA